MVSRDVQICAISGGSGAGKTTLAFKLLDRLGDDGSHLAIDWYYRDLAQLSARERAAVNFDHPESLEVDLFVEHLTRLESGEHVDAPVYNFSTHSRTAETQRIEARNCVVTEGIHLLGLEPVRARCALKVFVDVDADIRFARRRARDVAERGRSEESVRDQWRTTVAPMHDRFVQPGLHFADRVVTIDEDLDRVADELCTRLLSR